MVVIAVIATPDIVDSGLRTILGTDDNMRVLHRSERSGVGADVVLYDMIGLESGTDSELLRTVKNSDSALVMLGRDRRQDLLSRAMSVGVDAVLSIDAESSDVLSMMHAAARGDLELASGGAGAMGAIVGLSSREVEVLAQIVKGLSNAEIATELLLSTNTVKTYIRSAYQKIGVTSRTQAVSWCFQHGFEL